MPRPWSEQLNDMVQWVAERYGDPLIEHGVEENLLIHQADLKVPPLVTRTTLVMIHPVACGCDAVPDAVVVHG